MKRVLTALAATLPFAANAADAISGAVERQPTNWQAIIMFLIFVVFTLGITYWASKRVRSRNDYYTAGGNIFYLELAVDSTEFIKLHDFDASEEIDPDAIMAQTNQATANANRPAAGTGDDDETAALLKSLGM